MSVAHDGGRVGALTCIWPTATAQDAVTMPFTRLRAPRARRTDSTRPIAALAAPRQNSIRFRAWRIFDSSDVS